MESSHQQEAVSCTSLQFIVVIQIATKIIWVDVNLTQVDSRRSAFLRDNLDKIKSAIKENE